MGAKTLERPKSQVRADLAAAIAERRAVVDRLAELTGTDLWSASLDLGRARDAAAAALEAALEADTQAAAAAMVARRPPPSATAPAARAALEDAEQAVAVADRAREAIRQEQTDLQQREPFRRMAVEDRVAAVVAEEADVAMRALVADLDGMAAKWVDAMLALQSLVSAMKMNTTQASAHFAGRALGRSPYQWDHVADAAKPTSVAVTQWLAELEDDPDAAVPKISH